MDYSRQIKGMSAEAELANRQVEIERLQSLQSLQSLRPLKFLQSFGGDYQQVPIPENAVIYCDIPYNDTNCGKYDGFDHERFYKWAEKQDNIYISEYSMPENFKKYARKEKCILSAKNGNDQKAEEILFTNQKTYEKLNDDKKDMAAWNFAEKMTLF